MEEGEIKIVSENAAKTASDAAAAPKFKLMMLGTMRATFPFSIYGKWDGTKSSLNFQAMNSLFCINWDCTKTGPTLVISSAVFSNQSARYWGPEFKQFREMCQSQNIFLKVCCSQLDTAALNLGQGSSLRRKKARKYFSHGWVARSPSA